MAPKHAPVYHEFTDEGVTLHVPGQDKEVIIQKLAMLPLESMPAKPGGFQPFRAVINLKVMDAAQPNRELAVFDPPIEVRVRYTHADMKKAQEIGKPLSLGFWDGTQWIRFTPEKHTFRLEAGPSPEAGGWGVVTISNWADPTKGWGT